MSYTLAARLFALAFIATASTAFAEPVIITQDKAIAGNITPGDAAGYPITISETGTYRLESNLFVPGGVKNLIHVTANDVTIDLNGFAMFPGTNGVISGAAFLTIRNGRITGARNAGILDTGSSGGWVIEKMRIDFNQGPGISVGLNARIEDSYIATNQRSGIFSFSGVFIQGNIITGNRPHGIDVSRNGLILGNTIEGNGSSGINARNVDGLRPGYGNNLLQGNVQPGGGAQVTGNLIPLEPNACVPACP